MPGRTPAGATMPSMPKVKKPTPRAVGLLKRAPDNPREIDSANLEGLGYTMAEFGDLSGITWNRRTGELTTGHQRMERLEAAGARTWVEVSDDAGYIEHPRTGERFTIRIVDWDRQKQLAANIIANNPHLQGQFTTEVVGQLEQLRDEKAFAEAQLGRLLEDLAEDEEKADRKGGLEDFDAEPTAKPTWILISAPQDVAAELESYLRGQFADDPNVRIEKSNAAG
jgi:hypothetical protein